MKRKSLRTLVTRMHDLLDPDRQGLCWPDPIKWDGRKLVEQAGDLISLAETMLEPYKSGGEYYGKLNLDEIKATIEALERAVERAKRDRMAQK